MKLTSVVQLNKSTYLRCTQITRAPVPESRGGGNNQNSYTIYKVWTMPTDETTNAYNYLYATSAHVKQKIIKEEKSSFSLNFWWSHVKQKIIKYKLIIRLTIISQKSSSLLSAEIFSRSRTCTHWIFGAENMMLAPETIRIAFLSRK